MYFQHITMGLASTFILLSHVKICCFFFSTNSTHMFSVITEKNYTNMQKKKKKKRVVVFSLFSIEQTEDQ